MRCENEVGKKGGVKDGKSPRKRQRERESKMLKTRLREERERAWV